MKSVFVLILLAVISTSLGDVSYAPLKAPGAFCGTEVGLPHAPRTLRALAGAKLPPADTLSEPVIVEVMFLYTSQALKGAGSEAKVRQVIEESIEHTNFTFTNSHLNVRIDPVYIGEIAYTESGSINTDLSHVTNGENGLGRALTLRSAYEFVLRPYLFPGSFTLQSGSDLSGWTDAATVVADGLRPTADIKVPMTQPNAFFRLSSSGN